jgi:hypothetical protein
MVDRECDQCGYPDAQDLIDDSYYCRECVVTCRACNNQIRVGEEYCGDCCRRSAALCLNSTCKETLLFEIGDDIEQFNGHRCWSCGSQVSWR